MPSPQSPSQPAYFDPSWITLSDEVLRCDLCVYGATAAGVIASVTAAAEGLSVVLLQPGKFIGGMTTGGLGLTDFGAQHVIGGRARQFYRDLGQHYGTTEEWLFEPSAASAILHAYLHAARVTPRLSQFIASANVTDGHIQSIRLLGGLQVIARQYMDCTYEGDLLALAGVRYVVGREPNRQYGETINGLQIRDKHQFSVSVDPYNVIGKASSGLLPGINPQCAPPGSGDHRIQAYNFRVCMTDNPANRTPWPKPDNYEPARYELLRRWLNSDKDDYNELLLGGQEVRKFDRLAVATKTDSNNHGAVSSDFIGENYLWPEASYQHRQHLFRRHQSYQQGLYWCTANDDRVPAHYRSVYRQWGLATDEFTETGHWPHQLYVREARRMVSTYVLTEHDTQHHTKAPDAVGYGSYAMDSHNCQRVLVNGRLYNEGDVQLLPAGPYPISYRSIIPSPADCRNLFVPVCLSASHIAYGSIRMEPVFMILAESAALAAVLCIKQSLAPHDLAYHQLRPHLEKANQVIHAS